MHIEQPQHRPPQDMNCPMLQIVTGCSHGKCHFCDIFNGIPFSMSPRDEIVEDTRFNRAATDGSVFTDEGIYTVTIKNSTTGEETSKTIYVGENDLLKATVANQMDIADVEDQIAQGAVVAEDGTLMYAAVDLDVEEAQPEETAQEPEKVPEKNDSSDQASAGESDPADDDGSSMVLPIAGIVGVAALGAAGYGISRKGKKE